MAWSLWMGIPKPRTTGIQRGFILQTAPAPSRAVAGTHSRCCGKHARRRLATHPLPSLIAKEPGHFFSPRATGPGSPL